MDGVALAVHRVPGDGPPVILLHGLAANRLAFHFPGRSLAEHLASAGFDCFVPELRGAGESAVRKRRIDAWDYLELDIPAILDCIRETTGKQRVHWVGHSMGGLLMLAHGIGSAAPGLASGVAVGSALDYAVGGSAFERLLALRPVLERLPLVLPWGGLVHLLAPLLGRVDNPLQRLNFAPGVSEPEVCRAVHANVFGGIPTALLLSLGTTFQPGGFRSRDGTLTYLKAAARFPARVRFIAGGSDVQCPVATVEGTARAFGERADVRTFDGYGHFDLLLGRSAPQEVWPSIIEGLRAAPA
jgi:pimeloyl-ACP methyl ester carboxylesterase